MSYRVIVDSCGELTLQMKESGIFKTASLSMEVDGFHIPDDETFDQSLCSYFVRGIERIL